MQTDERELCRHWLDQSRQGEVRRRIVTIHDEVASRIRERDPVCTASGRCCDFERYGHRLYVTGLETAMTLDAIPRERALGDGDIERARSAGTCPFVVGGLCGVHPVRPVGCRVYFCDPSAQLWVNELAEFAADAVKRVHDDFGIEYRYTEWRAMLSMFREAGVARLPSEPVVFVPSDPFVPLTSGRA